MKAHNPNHWTTREFPQLPIFIVFFGTHPQPFVYILSRTAFMLKPSYVVETKITEPTNLEYLLAFDPYEKVSQPLV